MGGAFKLGGLIAPIDVDMNPFLVGIQKAKSEAEVFRDAAKKAGTEVERKMNQAKEAAVVLSTALGSGRKQLDQLNETARKLGERKIDLEVKGMDKNHKSMVQLEADIKKTNDAISTLKQNLNAVSTKRLEAQFAGADLEKKLNGPLGMLMQAGSMLSGSWIANFLGVTGSAYTAKQIVAGIVGETVKWQDAFAAVRKSIDGTPAELKKIEAGIASLSLRMPSSPTDLLRTAALGGQLGIPTGDILGFTEMITKFSEVTGMANEEAATFFAQWSNITGLPVEQLQNMASTVLLLGNSTAATEQDILSFGVRLASAGKIAHLADSEIAALAASLASTGLRPELGGTAFSKLLMDLRSLAISGGPTLALFSAVAGKTSQDFQHELRDNMSGAIVDFLRGLKMMQDGGADMAKTLDTLGFKDAEMVRALGNASNAAEIFAKSIGQANGEFKAGATLTDKWTVSQERLSAKWGTFSNEVAALARTIGGELSPALSDSLGFMSELLRLINEGPSEVGLTKIKNYVSEALKAGYYIANPGALAGEKLRSAAQSGLAQAFSSYMPQFGQESGDGFVGFTIALSATEERAKGLREALDAAAEEMGNFLQAKSVEGMQAQAQALQESADRGNKLAEALKSAAPVTSQLTRDLADLKAAGRTDNESLSLLASKTWKDMGAAAFVTLDGIVAKLNATGDAIDKNLAGKLQEFAAQAREDAMTAQQLDKDTFDAWAKEQEKQKQRAEQLFDKFNPSAKAFLDIQDTFTVLANVTDGLHPDYIQKFADYIFEDFGKKMPDVLQGAIEYFRQINDEMGVSAIAGIDLSARLEDLRNQYIALNEAKLTKSDGLERDGITASPGDQLYNSLHRNDPAQVVERLKTSIIDLGPLLDTSTAGLLAAQTWSDLDTHSKKALGDIIDLLRLDFTNASDDVKKRINEIIQAWDKLKKPDAQKNKIRDLNELSGALGTASDLAEGLSGHMTGLSATFKVASIGIHAFAQASEIAADETRAAWESALGIFGVILEAVYQLANAFGLLGDKGKKEAKGVDKVWKDFGQDLNGMLDDLSQQIVKGEQDFQQFALNAAEDLASIAVKELMLQPIVNFGKDLLFNADGNAFNAGMVIPFASGGVVTAPTYFPMRGGRAGVMGEAGPEAVVPLERMPGGKLGINARGGVGGGEVSVHVYDQRAASAPPVQIETVTGPNGAKQVHVMIREAVKDAVNRGEFDATLGRAFGLSRVGG